jgi:putative serine protease PepD
MLEHMTEHPDDAPRADDDTTRLPTDPAGPSTHRYDARVGGFAFADRPEPERQRRSRPGGAVIGGILAGALLVGGLSGLAGAAGYTALQDSSGGSSSSSPGRTTSSSVVDRQDSAAAPDSVEGVAAAVLPSVVKINVSGQQGQGSGSGIVISSDGEILTNNHVAAVAGQGGDISVSFEDGSAKRATIVGTDPLTDLAVIKAEGVSGLTPASIGVSTHVSVGENVVAIGSPFGLEATVTSGIVSALNRPVSVGSSDSSQSGQDTTYPAIQTDAAINPGNSGGPLVDLNGDVIGINSSIRTASSGGVGSESGGSIGLGFAIPIDQVWPVVQQLRAGDTPTHARLGVSVTDASSDNGLLTGAGIEQVNNGEAGDQAGLQSGDVVTKVDDDIITGADSLVATVRGHRPGDKVTLTVVRDGKTRTLDVTLDSDKGTPSR